MRRRGEEGRWGGRENERWRKAEEERRRGGGDSGERRR